MKYADAALALNVKPGPSAAFHAHNRLVLLGYGKPCGRCGGSGHYSYSNGSTRCFQCNGHGVYVPESAVTPAMLAEARAKQDAGALADHFAKCAARKAANRATLEAANRQTAALSDALCAREAREAAERAERDAMARTVRAIFEELAAFAQRAEALRNLSPALRAELAAYYAARENESHFAEIRACD